VNRRFNLEDYETVDQRLAEFHQRHPNGRIVTHIITLDEKKVVMRAEAYRDDLDLVTEEHRAKEYLNRIAGRVFSSSPQEIIDTAEEVHIYRKTDQ